MQRMETFPLQTSPCPSTGSEYHFLMEDRLVARPTKSSLERRDVRLNLRLTPAERIALDIAAAKAGFAPSEYARMQALNGRITVRAGKTLSPELFTQLVRIGTNLNQIAHRLNAGDPRVPPALAHLCEQLEAILAREVAPDDPAP
jgi:hypothetical protein